MFSCELTDIMCFAFEPNLNTKFGIKDNLLFVKSGRKRRFQVWVISLETCVREFIIFDVMSLNYVMFAARDCLTRYLMISHCVEVLDDSFLVIELFVCYSIQETSK